MTAGDTSTWRENLRTPGGATGAGASVTLGIVELDLGAGGGMDPPAQPEDPDHHLQVVLEPLQCGLWVGLPCLEGPWAGGVGRHRSHRQSRVSTLNSDSTPPEFDACSPLPRPQA